MRAEEVVAFWRRQAHSVIGWRASACPSERKAAMHITVIGKDILLQSTAEAEDPYPAFDAATARMDKRLRRYKRRLRDYHKRVVAQATVPAPTYIVEASSDDPVEDRAEPGQPVVVAEMPTQIGQMTVSQAVMRMDLTDQPALLFRNVAHGGLNMIYRRTDGNIGWVDPQGSELKGS